MVKLSRTKETKKIMGKYDLEDYDLGEDCYNTIFLPVSQLMFNGSDLKTIVQKTGLITTFVKKLFESWELETHINSTMSIAEIYMIPDEVDMEIALEEFTLKWESMENGSFKYPEHYRKGFFYVDKGWVKKDRRGRVVKRIELPTEEKAHFKEKWFLDLKEKYRIKCERYYEVA